MNKAKVQDRQRVGPTLQRIRKTKMKVKVLRQSSSVDYFFTGQLFE